MGFDACSIIPSAHKYYPSLPFFIKPLKVRGPALLPPSHALTPAIWFPWQHCCFSAHQNLHDSLVTQSSGLSLGVNHRRDPSAHPTCLLPLCVLVTSEIYTSPESFLTLFPPPLSSPQSSASLSLALLPSPPPPRWHEHCKVLGVATFPSLLIFFKVYFRTLTSLQTF